MEILAALIYITVFPGFLFLASYGTALQWADRKISAVMQNRVGPPWYQTLADFIKLASKEIVVPDGADIALFKALPYVAVASVSTAVLFLPVFGAPVYSFQGDLIAVIYLLTIPTATFFLAGWSSTSPYASVGSIRVMTQLFGYEVPLLLALVGPAILAGSWSVAEISAYFSANPKMIFFQIIGFAVSLLALQGKLERVPFDSPHAKNEIVGGQFTEYSGMLLALFNLSIDMEMVVGAALISAVFLGGTWQYSSFAAFAVFMVKTFAVVFLLTAIKAAMARVRIDQMVNFCWKYLAPLSMLQIIIDLYIKYGVK
ncbi:MAG: NADH-quinone oxidoreductase subunit H [Elusimicrobia bacterium]|nr:NADH-quinone oxidoreductase subunit H [Elusimicrobiota bacterium]